MIGGYASNQDDRLRVLQMIENGKINAAEGIEILGALGKERVAPPPPPAPALAGGGARWLRIRVTDLATGRNKATVSLPVGLVNWGMRNFGSEVGNFDMNDLVRALDEGAQGMIIDVTDEEDGEHVEIYLE
jgi:hypothetical protein